MQVRHFPPTRRSISHTGHCMPSGPHHCAKSLGSVKAAKTRAGGALNSRSMPSTGSRSLAAAAAAALAMAFLRGGCLFVGKEFVEMIEARIPEGAVAFDPFRRLLERLRRQAAG